MGFFFRKRSVQNSPFNASPTQAGNAVVIVLVGIALFGALAGVFMRGSQSGQGNLTDQQARLAAQEILDFFTGVNGAFQKLRQKGCPQDDISFASSGDTSDWGANNASATAPSDKSCNIFDPAGGNLSFTLETAKYQLARSQIALVSPGNETNGGNINFRIYGASNVGVGTVANDVMAHYNFVRPEVCRAINKTLGLEISEVTDSGPIAGDENTSYVGKEVFCRINPGSSNGQFRYVWVVQ